MTDLAHSESTASRDMVLHVDVQQALNEQEFAETEEPPSRSLIAEWANAAYSSLDGGSAEKISEVTIRLVEVDEMTQLNRDYRQQDKPTNVLSFPCEPFPFAVEGDSALSVDNGEPELDFSLLGDIVICHPVIVSEARAQQKTVSDHYAHMVTHGLLHLCGYDHQDEKTAQQMESLETEILAQAGITNPYNGA